MSTMPTDGRRGMSEVLSLGRPTAAVWAGLVIATLVSWWLGSEHGIGPIGAQGAATAVLLVAFAKVWVVGRYFMELRTAPVFLSGVFTAWTVVVAAVLVVMVHST